MNRKDFIKLIGGSTLASMALGQLSCTKVDSAPRLDFTIDLADPVYSSLTIVGNYIYLNGLIIFKGIDFNYYALSQYCTHNGCNVEYQPGFNEVVCPCHGSQYDLYGQVLMGPAEAPLYQFATELNNGTLLRIYTP